MRARLPGLLPFVLTLVLAACGDGSTTRPRSVPTAGLLSHQTFDGDATDQSGNGNHGTLAGSAVASGALVLGDNGTDLLSLPGSVMDGLENFTIAAWLRLDVLRGGSHEMVSGANAAEDNALIFWYAESSGDWRFGINDASSAFPGDTRIEDGAWHHVSLTRAATTARLYLDGVELGSTPVIGDVLDIDPGGLVFGQDQDVVGGAYEPGESWAGAMDNLRIYNRALSASEVEWVAGESR